MTTPDVMTVVNYERFGKLVQCWATGQDLFKDGKNYKVPLGLQDRDWFIAELGRLGTGALVPDRYTSIEFVQSTPSKLVIRLPEAAPLQQAMDDLAVPGAVWSLPTFYIDEFGAHNLDPNTPPDQKGVAFGMRVTDYTIAVCIGQ